jgi:hypothetical protein
MNNSGKTIGIVVAVVAVLACCLCLVVAAVLGLFNLTRFARGTSNQGPIIEQLQTAIIVEPTPGSAVIATPVPEITRDPARAAGAAETNGILAAAEIPENDPADLAQRLQGITDIPATVEPPAQTPRVGDTNKFWLTNTDTNENFQVDATLRYEGKNVYFWVENDVQYNQGELDQLGETFDTKIYPTNREFFGSEWNPGIDGDPRLYIVYVQNVGGVAGYFSSADEIPPAARPDSNGHEMFILSADYVDLGSSEAYGVLAHEFQHMIHYYRDRNEESWMNEGFSDLASFLNGYDTGGHEYSYTDDTDLQLNDWPNNPNDPYATIPHYGASFLFLTYFLDRFGEDMTKALVGETPNGMTSVDKVLADSHVTDAVTGNPVKADDVFQDWTLANYLKDNSVGDGRFDYKNYKNGPQAFETETVDQCPTTKEQRSVNQYGVDYIVLDCGGSHTVQFSGSTIAKVVPADPHSGNYAFWSNKGDESDMTLSQEFDFSKVSGQLELQYWTWYDLEHDYDYLYVEAQADGGEWQILHTPSGTDENPSGNSYGWGYNGSTGEWIQESVDLSEYAGKKVTLRFEYITDAAVNGEGFLLDDISIPQIQYSSDFETDDGGWQAGGWVRIQNALPQTYRLAVIHTGNNPSVEYIPLDAENTAAVKIDGQAVLVVSGTTRFTRIPTSYQFIVD